MTMGDRIVGDLGTAPAPLLQIADELAFRARHGDAAGREADRASGGSSVKVTRLERKIAAPFWKIT